MAPPRQRTGHTAQDPGRRKPRRGALLRSHRAMRVRRTSSLRGAHQQIPAFGPSFFTKFLYFAGKTLRPAHGPEPLILDRLLSLRLRSLAINVGRDTGHDPDGSLAAWIWADWNWSPHRYQV
ncbi:8-oxoguanine DNA glycosylase OGG fold protein [Streptomyces asiaticus]